MKFLCSSKLWQTNMAALNQCISQTNRVVCHQRVLKFYLSVSNTFANFQSILNCFIQNFKLKYASSKNVKTDHVRIVVFNLHQVKQRTVFWDIRQIGILSMTDVDRSRAGRLMASTALLKNLIFTKFFGFSNGISLLPGLKTCNWQCPG